MKYQLLIFDWDGTLADSAQQIVNAMQKAIRGLQLPPRPDESIRELIGLGLNEGLQILYPDIEVQKLRGLLDSYRAQWLSEGGGEAPLFKGALDALAQLHAQGHTLTIATGKSRRGLDRSLRHHAELNKLMTASRCADETASKPNPLMLRELLEELDVKASDALMIGDTEYDMAMARSIGMDGLGVTCGVHESARIQAAGAKALIEDVSRLPAWLASA